MNLIGRFRQLFIIVIAIQFFVSNADCQGVNELITELRNGNLDSVNETLLENPSVAFELEYCNFLVQNPKYIKSTNVDQLLASHLLPLVNDVELAKYLVEELGADVNFEPRRFVWPLDAAIRACNVDLVEYLLSQNANPNIETFDGSLLSNLADGGMYLSYLRKRVHDLRVREEERLNIAIMIDRLEKNELEILTLLIENGGNLDYVTHDEKNLWQIAKSSGNDEVVALLDNYKDRDDLRREGEPLRPREFPPVPLLLPQPAGDE